VAKRSKKESRRWLLTRERNYRVTRNGKLDVYSRCHGCYNQWLKGSAAEHAQLEKEFAQVRLEKQQLEAAYNQLQVKCQLLEILWSQQQQLKDSRLQYAPEPPLKRQRTEMSVLDFLDSIQAQCDQNK
jgi:hypothetical protein